MRAYKLQSQGYDTYDADEVLGFEIDQRRFDFAAEMLRQLDVKHVRLITNNPEKIAALRKAGPRRRVPTPAGARAADGQNVRESCFQTGPGRPHHRFRRSRAGWPRTRTRGDAF